MPVNFNRNTREALVFISSLLLTTVTFLGAQSAAAGNYSYNSSSPTASSLPGADFAKQVAPSKPKEGTKVGVVLKTLNNQYWQAVQAGMLAAAKDLGVHATIQAAKSETDPMQQLTIAQTMIGQHYDVYIVAPLTGSDLTPAIKQLQELGAPVVNAVDARVPSTVYVGSSHELDGSQAANYIAEHLPDGGEVAQIEGLAGSDAAFLRIKGFKEGIAKHPNLKLVASVPGNWDTSMAYNDTQTLLQKDPNIKAFYANNDTMALGVAKAVSDMGLGGKIVIVGTDGIPAVLNGIKDGSISATITPLPYYEGYWSMESAVRLVNGEKVPEWIISPAQIVTKDNIGSFYDSDMSEKTDLFK